MGLYAIGMWDRNWKLPDDLFLIEHLYNILRLRMTNVEVLTKVVIRSVHKMNSFKGRVPTMAIVQYDEKGWLVYISQRQFRVPGAVL